MDYMNTITKNIRDIIDERGLKYKAVATMSNIGVGRFYRLMQGGAQITCEEVADVCTALNITPNDVFYGVSKSA